MKLSEMKKLGEVIEDLRRDPEFRQEWDGSAIARQVAVVIVRYREERNLSQRELAEMVGMNKAAIGRLELGEHQPNFETLAKLTRATGMTFHIEIANGAAEVIETAA